MDALRVISLFAVMAGLFGVIAFLAYLPAIMSHIRVRWMKAELDRRIAALPGTFGRSIQIETRPLGLGSMECERGTASFADVRKHGDAALEAVLKLMRNMD